MKAANSRGRTETVFHFRLKGGAIRCEFAKNKPNNGLANSTNDALVTKRRTGVPPVPRPCRAAAPTDADEHDGKQDRLLSHNEPKHVRKPRIFSTRPRVFTGDWKRKLVTEDFLFLSECVA